LLTTQEKIKGGLYQRDKKIEIYRENRRRNSLNTEPSENLSILIKSKSLKD
tara:strand:- start:36 stop:188 length:153 start_codon:yes stop_codon:yes gene_type:complete